MAVKDTKLCVLVFESSSDRQNRIDLVPSELARGVARLYGTLLAQLFMTL